jgi:hypothetical protein
MSFNRYLSADTPLQTVTPSQTSKINDLGENKTVTPKTDVTVSKSSNQLNSFTCDGVTDENPLPGAGRGVTPLGRNQRNNPMQLLYDRVTRREWVNPYTRPVRPVSLSPILEHQQKIMQRVLGR